MTEAEKQARKEIIKERNEKESYVPYWITRSSRSGILSDHVDVWTARPDRRVYGELVFWVCEGHYWGRWTLDQAFTQIRFAIPEDDRQCVKNG